MAERKPKERTRTRARSFAARQSGRCAPQEVDPALIARFKSCHARRLRAGRPDDATGEAKTSSQNLALMAVCQSIRDLLYLQITGPGPRLDQNVLGQLRHGSPGLDFWASRVASFPPPQGLRSVPAPLFGAKVSLGNRD